MSTQTGYRPEGGNPKLVRLLFCVLFFYPFWRRSRTKHRHRKHFRERPPAARRAVIGRGLGTGRVDHKLIFLVSRKFGAVDIDLNGAYLILGREDAPGRMTGGQGARSFAGEFENGFGPQGELSGQSKDDVQPKGLFAMGALPCKANRCLVLDAGMRFRLNPDAPRAGVFAGLTAGITDFYKK